MQVKRLPEDFVVREISRFPVRPKHHPQAGRYAVYLLEKMGLGTPEATSAVLSIWNLPRNHVAYGGLKDRHAVTAQTLTILDGPSEDLVQPGFSLTYRGQASRHFTAQDIQANEFEITLRQLPRQRAEWLAAQLQQSGWAVPNYFDDQRFGSLGESGRYVAHAWCLADYEQALYLALAEANRHDRPDDRQQKELLRAHWGDWQVCKERLDRSHRRSIVTYLVDHPSGFKKAAALIRQDLRSIYVAAFQSKIWNEIVSRKLSRMFPAEAVVTQSSVAGNWAFPLSPSPAQLAGLSECRIPLPSGRQSAWTPETSQLLDEVLAEFGMQRHQLRFSHPRDVFFARGLRDLLLQPRVSQVELLRDDSQGSTDSCPLRVRLQLSAGQYATMLIKGLELLAAAQTEPNS